MSDDLKPCPFCGGPAVAGDDGADNRSYEVCCGADTDCCAAVRFHNTPAEAIVAWNTRTDDELKAKADALAEENARLRRLASPDWFYLAGDTSSDKCRFSPSEVIDEDWLYENSGTGSAVVCIETAAKTADIWCAVKFFTNEEKDARNDDEPFILTEHATEDAAKDALKGETP